MSDRDEVSLVLVGEPMFLCYQCIYGQSIDLVLQKLCIYYIYYYNIFQYIGTKQNSFKPDFFFR